MSASSSLGLAFSISPAKKHFKKPEKDEEIYILILAPFNKAPKINFGQLKKNDIVEKSLLIINPQDFNVKLSIKNADLNINNLEVEIEKQSNIDFKLKWQPIKADTYKFTITFEVFNSRLKFIVHAFGTCVEPPKKKIHKPLTVLQPIRPINMKPVQNKTIEATLKSTSNNKENQTSKLAKQDPKKTIPSSKTTIITKISEKTTVTNNKNSLLDNTVQQFEQILEHVVKKEFCETATCLNSTQNNDQQRRQTEILRTPKLNTQLSLDFFRECNNEASNSLNFSLSESNLANLGLVSSNITSNCTTITTNTVTTTIAAVDDLLLKTPMLNSTCMVSLRRSLSETNLKESILKQQQYYEQQFNPAVSMTPKLKLHFNDNDDSTVLVDQENNNLNHDHEKHIIEKLDQLKCRYSAIRIQRFYRRYKREKVENQVKLMRERRAVKIIAKHWCEYKRNRLINTIRKRFAARLILKNYRFYKEKVYFERKLQIIRKNAAARVIQLHWNKYKQQKRESKAANTIKRYWFAHKFRKCFYKYRNAAIKIQKWSREMKERYYYLHLKRVVIYLQQKYKQRYCTRTVAAYKIQRYYRLYKYRMRENEQNEQLNYAASIIQATWKGYKTRKEINLVQIRSIRERLSVYVQNKSKIVQFTLGYRIKRSLKVLEQQSPTIQQVITALMDLQIVTRLSQECCIQFANAGAIHILYEFITRCNRSTPHMDLIKLCLEILINLAKCQYTCDLIINFDNELSSTIIQSNELNILLNLLQAYQSSNAQIFMNVCVLLIILTSNEKLGKLKEEIMQQNFLKKLLQLNTVLERRANFRIKKQRTTFSNQELLNESLNSSCSAANSHQINISFSLEPEWSLSNRKLFIQLIEPLGALQYLLINTLDVKIDCSLDNLLKTPKKTIDLHIENKIGSASLSAKKRSESLTTLDSSNKKLPVQHVNKSANVVMNGKPVCTTKGFVSNKRVVEASLKTSSSLQTINSSPVNTNETYSNTRRKLI